MYAHILIVRSITPSHRHCAMTLSAKVEGGGGGERGRQWVRAHVEVEGRRGMGFGPCTEHAKKGLGEWGMGKGLPNYTITVNISKITTQRGKGSIDFHNDLSVSGVG